jgi:hypothetical protein
VQCSAVEASGKREKRDETQFTTKILWENLPGKKEWMEGDSREGDFMDNFIGFEEKNKISAL